jgi:hypothetical protein
MWPAYVGVGVVHLDDPTVERGALDDRSGRLDLGQFRHGGSAV